MNFAELTPQHAPSGLMALASAQMPDAPQALERARAFAEPLISTQILDTGENVLAHAQAMAQILKDMGGTESMQAASYLVYACEHLNKPQEVFTKAFGESYAVVAVETTQLVRLQRQARNKQHLEKNSAQAQRIQTENIRRMLMAFSKDLRVVLLRLASRLQTLRFFAATKKKVPIGLVHESLQVFAALANRLGIWQIKWEIEDLSFRFLDPDTYRQIAQQLEGKRTEREAYILQLRQQFEVALKEQGITVMVEGRPKHIYSIVKKMRGKSLNFDQVLDVHALRVIVATVHDCYGALSWVHANFQALQGEFDDYIAKPKANGYQSLHTVVRDNSGRPIEIQVRTRDMHSHAEYGVAAHWAYKEAGTKGYSGVSANSAYDQKIAVLRQLLAWERELSTGSESVHATSLQNVDDRIYALTPQAEIVELPSGSTAIDFAYTVHTTLGHRCRGAKLDGQMVPLNTPLKNGQTVEIIAIKEGGPSRDWLNPELGFLASHRARAKARAWFNAQETKETITKGREQVEKILQREGKTAIKLEEMASQLGFDSAEDLFEVVGKDEFSLRNIEILLKPPEPVKEIDDIFFEKASRHRPASSSGGVLVVGVDSLLTQLAKCCKPAPPDLIRGFVTRGKGVSIHRSNCSNFFGMSQRNAGRVIDVAWGVSKNSDTQIYPVDVEIHAFDRQGLLRDISEVFAKEKINVIGIKTQSIKDMAHMTFTVEVSLVSRLQKVLEIIQDVSGVRTARRR
ncbi:MAG: bifunctional (p)ppGpp synthetase/guanosine-3',5'-bis(diphosphate) 3'-pyrophosphohydrolase [Limnohabitans sp.]|nr:bifunctional (p)ppGpp synthetase/guanosine-3',5'-bis(diphosphate) 3'-pyrophosphohydrolase [Limnohabitans sp.]